MTVLLLVVLAFTLTALAASLWLLKRSETREGEARLDLLGAHLVAEAATHTTTILAGRVKDRDDQIEQMVDYLDDAGLVDVLNDELLPDGPGGDDPKGMPN